MEHMLGEGGKTRLKLKLYTAFFCIAWSKIVTKVKIQKKLHIGIQCPEQLSQEERVFIIFSKKF